MASTLEFGYQFVPQYKNWFPIIPLRLHGRQGRFLESFAYLDSGAAFSIFQINELVNLGLEWSEGKPREVVVGDGVKLQCRMFQLPVDVGPHRFVTPIAFSKGLKIGFNLLGLHGFFEEFDRVTFEHHKRRVLLIRP